MKTVLVIAALLCTTSCAALFFGGKVIGPYYRHFKGKMECAYVSGWHVEKKCLCWIIERGFSENKTFLVSENEAFCQQQIDP